MKRSWIYNKMTKSSVVCIIENDKKEILLQKKTLDYPNYPGIWSPFGGEAESEDMEKEMNRELEEEIGIKLDIKLLFNQKIKLHEEKVMFYVYLANLNNISVIRIGEGAGLAFFGKEELRKLKFRPEDKKILYKYIKKFK